MIFLYNSSSILLLVAILRKILQPGGICLLLYFNPNLCVFFITLPLKCISSSVIVNGKLGISGASYH